MIAPTLRRARDIAAVVGGSLLGVGPDAHVESIVTDSRTLPAGALFIAVPGVRFDGHDFAVEAVGAGAVAALVSRPVEGVPSILVADTVQAYADLAHAHLDWLRSRPSSPLQVVGITGSSGKTSTKDLIAHVLVPLGPVVSPPGSFNNEVGLPATVLQADESTRALVLEMGMRGLGHIAHLCRTAPPDVSVVLNVGSAHLGELGSRDAIALAKGEIVEGVRPGGVVVLNADDPYVRAMAARTTGRVLLVGESADSDVRISDITLDAQARPSFTLHSEVESVHVTLALHGEHHVANAAAAAAVGLACGMSLTEVADRLESARPGSRWRMEVHQTRDGITVVNDAYNANPESVRAALKALVAMAAGRRTWAVLGEMRELGEDSVSEHDAIGRLAVRLDISHLVAVGDGARPIHMGAAHEGSWGEESMAVANAEEASAVLRERLRPGDVVLVKASRSIGLERVAETLLAERGTVEPS